MIAVSSESKNKIEMVIIPIKVHEFLSKELKRVIGENASSDLNFEQGKKIGMSLVRGKHKNDPEDIKRYLKKLILIGYYSGVSSKNSHIKTFSNNKIVLSGKSRFDPKSKDSYSNPTLSYVTGYIVGFMEELTQKKWKGKYTKKIKDKNIIIELIIERKNV
jgi:hypothetical protein